MRHPAKRTRRHRAPLQLEGGTGGPEEGGGPGRGGDGGGGGRGHAGVALEGAGAVDGEEEEDVPRGGVGVGEGVEVLELGCPGAL